MTFASIASISHVCARRAVGLGLFLLVLTAAPPEGVAQSVPLGTGCILDHCADKKPLPSAVDMQNDGASARRAAGNFAFYVLSLSWSPGFCATGGARKARAQCVRGSALGFVVHGLWPQYNHGYPSDCGLAARSPSRIALQETKGLYPDEGLARYEWRKHGTCSGKSPLDYFADVRRARAAITIPPPFRDPHQNQTWTPVDIQRAFIAANPRLRPGMLAVECMRSTLREVRVCFSKDLRNFVACPEVARHFCYARQIAVPPAQ